MPIQSTTHSMQKAPGNCPSRSFSPVNALSSWRQAMAETIFPKDGAVLYWTPMSGRTSYPRVIYLILGSYRGLITRGGIKAPVDLVTVTVMMPRSSVKPISFSFENPLKSNPSKNWDTSRSPWITMTDSSRISTATRWLVQIP